VLQKIFDLAVTRLRAEVAAAIAAGDAAAEAVFAAQLRQLYARAAYFEEE
jgi:hypothetical protein